MESTLLFYKYEYQKKGHLPILLSEWLCNGHFMTYHYRFYVPTIELSFPVKGDCKGNYELAARWILLQICISNVKRYRQV